MWIMCTQGSLHVQVCTMLLGTPFAGAPLFVPIKYGLASLAG